MQKSKLADRWKAAALTLSLVTVIMWYGRAAGHEDRGLEASKTNPYVVIGIPALASLFAWVLFFIYRRRNQAAQ